MRKMVVVALVALLLGVLVGHNTNVYNAQNKGITVGSCGYEVYPVRMPWDAVFCGN